MTTRFLSESELLRKCNFAATPKWRSFLRERLPHEVAGNQILYRADEAEALAAQISDFAAETNKFVSNSTPATSTSRTRGGLQTR